MSDLPHLRIPSKQATENYTYAGGTPQGVVFHRPVRNQPAAHAAKLRTELEDAQSQASQQRAVSRQAHPELVQWQPEGVVLTFHGDPDFDLNLESLERLRAGIDLLSCKEEGGVQVAKVFVPEGHLNEYLKLVDAYANSVVMDFEAPEEKEQELKDLADPDNGVRVYGAARRSNGKVKVRFLVGVGQQNVFAAKVGTKATLVTAGPKNEKLIASISSIRLALVRDFWQDRLDFPDENHEMWWEVWLRGTRATADAVHKRFQTLAGIVGIARVSQRYVAFPERVVVHAYASAHRLAASIDLVTMFAELRKAKELSTYYVNLEPAEQGEFIADVVERLVLPEGESPCVTIMDGGVNRGHLLIEPGLAAEDMHAADPAWEVADSFPDQHGTGMAGIALYGCLTGVMTQIGDIVMRHRLESVKILPPPPAENDPPDYGRVMQDGVVEAHIKTPQRNRVLCMAVTADDREQGLPSLWSGAVDDLCAGIVTGKPQLMFVSAGNIREDLYKKDYVYHEWNQTRAAIDDPAQAWNVLTVGAMTNLCTIQQEGWEGWHPIAESGDLCPTSRTSLAWPAENQKGWPIKPDIVMEGGNYAESGTSRSSADDLSMLTTILHPSGRLLDTTRDTSPATALAARDAAILWSHYPKLWPETVRALMVHSAKWTQRMIDRFPGTSKAAAQQRLRCYGYGVPDLRRAIHSAENAVSLTFEGELQPFCKKGSEYRTCQMHIHELPWPVEVLQGLGAALVRMRVTLSYFIEPSPGSVGWKVNTRYASHGLRFDVIRPTENLEAFKRRISRDFWENKKRPVGQAKETRNWVIGDNGQTNGCIHSDWWVGRAADLAACGKIVIYPVTGWWKDRHHLGRYENKARYSMVVSLESDDKTVDLYTPIAKMVDVQTEILV
jgi:hypothetical protein